MEGAGAVVGTHAVDLSNDEAQLRERLCPPREGFRDEGAVGPSIDILHNRVCLRRVEIGWQVDHAPDISFAVAPLGMETERRLPACGDELGNVGRLDLLELGIVAGAVECHARGQIDA